MNAGPPVETFEALSALPGVLHGFTLRVPTLDVQMDREAALARLDRYHAEAREMLGVSRFPLVTATQVHGRMVLEAEATTEGPVGEADAIVTADPAVCLGIYVADCCAIYFVDPVRNVIGIAHSGRKGTEQRIATAVIERMQGAFGCDPGDLVVQLSPCIRPPHYEIDFASAIVAQCREAGVRNVHDGGANTGADLQRYYSYRMEKGKTGRMLALLALH